MKISIILPVYNVSKYIEKCILSLINQTYKNIEIVFINDGTKDNSVDIIKKYMIKDKRIKLFSKENGGQATARNLGLLKATGEYVCFIDSDDYISENMIEELYLSVLKKQYDIVIFNYIMDAKKQKKCKVFKGNTILLNDYVILTPCPWNKMYKKSFLLKNNFSFPEGIIYEDYASIPSLVKYHPTINYIDKYLYYYVFSDDSTMRSVAYKKKYEDILIASKILYDNLINQGYNLELEYMLTYHMLYLGSLNFYKYQKYDMIYKIADLMKELFPKWYKNSLINEKFSLSERIYMWLFYKKQTWLINLYRRIFMKNEKRQNN